MTKIKVPSSLDERFRELEADNATIQAKYANFSQTIHEEQRDLAMKAKALWSQTINDMGLEGDWQYNEGFIHPVDPVDKK